MVEIFIANENYIKIKSTMSGSYISHGENYYQSSVGSHSKILINHRDDIYV
jgi:hypothetical protein